MPDSAPSSKLDQLIRIGLHVFAVALVLAMYPFTADPTGDIKAFLTAWAAAILGGAWLVGFALGQCRFRRPRIAPEILLLFLAFYLLSTYFSPYPSLALIEVQRFTFLAVLYLVASQVFHDIEQVRRFLATFCIAVALSTGYAFMQLGGLDPFPWAERESDVYTNLPGTFGNPNYAAHTLILTIILGIYLAVSGRRWCWPLVGLFLIHLNFTDQRAGWIALAAGACLVGVAWLLGKRLASPIKGVALTLIITALLGIAGLGAVMVYTKARTGSPFPLDVSLLIRYQSYVSATNMILEKPLIGHGPGAYKLIYPPYWTPYEQQWFAQTLRMNEHVHNDPLEVAVDAGLPAAGLFLALLVMAMAYGLLMAFRAEDKRLRWLGYSLSALFLAFLVDGLFGFNLRVPVSAGLFFLLLGITELTWRREENQHLRGFWALRVAGIVVAILTLVFAVQEGRRFASEREMHRGMSLQTAGRYEAARMHLLEGERLAPWNGHFQRRLGDGALAERKLEDAQEHFENSLAIFPDHFLTHLPLAHTKILLAQSDPNRPMEERLALLQEAARHGQAILDIAPQFARAEAALGHIGFLSAALISTAPSPSMAARATQYWEQAETHIERAISFGADDPAELYRMLAQTRIALTKLPEAEEAFVRAAQSVEGARETWPAFLDFARKHNRYERLRDALYADIAAQRERLAVDEAASGNLAMSLVLLANVLENGYRSLDEAAAAYDQAVDAAPTLETIWANYARFAAAHDYWARLEEAVLRAVNALEEREAELPAQLAIMGGVLRNGVDALFPATATLLANVRAHGGQQQQLSAEQAYGWAARYLQELAMAQEAPAVCSSLFNLGITFSALGQPATAERLFERAAPCLPESEQAFLYLHRGNNLAAWDRSNDALALFAEGRERFPENVELRWAYARLLGNTGLRDAAKQEYRALLEEEGLDPTGRAMLQRELRMLEGDAGE